MPDLILLGASALMLVAFAVHVIIGGKHVARPLLADARLPRAAKWLSYYCWHLVSLMLFALALGLGWGAFHGIARPAVMALCAFFTACGALSAYCAIKGQIHPLRFPSTTLFFVSAVLLAADLVAVKA